MLYDPKWEQKTETKADPFSLQSLIAWLEKQPAAGEYNFLNCSGGCLYGLYMQSHGFLQESYLKQAKDFRLLVFEYVAMPEPWTFGAALERARKIAAQS